MVNCGQHLDLGLVLPPSLHLSLFPSHSRTLNSWIFGSLFTFPIHLFRIRVYHSPLLNVLVCAYYHMAQIFASPSLRAFGMQWLTSSNDTSGNVGKTKKKSHWRCCCCLLVFLHFFRVAFAAANLRQSRVRVRYENTSVQTFAEQLFPPIHTSLNASQLMKITIWLNKVETKMTGGKKRRKSIWRCSRVANKRVTIWMLSTKLAKWWCGSIGHIAWHWFWEFYGRTSVSRPDCARTSKSCNKRSQFAKGQKWDFAQLPDPQSTITAIYKRPKTSTAASVTTAHMERT